MPKRRLLEVNKEVCVLDGALSLQTLASSRLLTWRGRQRTHIKSARPGHAGPADVKSESCATGSGIWLDGQMDPNKFLQPHSNCTVTVSSEQLEALRQQLSALSKGHVRCGPENCGLTIVEL